VADRKTLLSRLVAGDIVLADGPDGARPPCLIYEVTATTIKARAVTTQAHYVFDRETGIGDWRDGRPVTIRSLAPLPVDIHNIILGLDRKNRLLLDIEDAALNEDEKNALLFLYDHRVYNQI
jgi:hypothetical protein